MIECCTWFNDIFDKIAKSKVFYVPEFSLKWFHLKLNTEQWTLNSQSIKFRHLWNSSFLLLFFHKLVPFIGPLCILVKGLFMLFNIINSIYWIPSCILCNVHLMKMVCTWIFELFVLWILFSLFYVILFLREIKKTWIFKYVLWKTDRKWQVIPACRNAFWTPNQFYVTLCWFNSKYVFISNLFLLKRNSL